jgi:hypothetical protein
MGFVVVREGWPRLSEQGVIGILSPRDVAEAADVGDDESQV